MKAETPYSQKDPLTVWIINHYAITPHFSGGTRHYDFSRYLTSQNHRVTLWLCSFLHNKSDYVSKAQRREITASLPENFDLKWLWAPAYRRNGIFRALNMIVFSTLLLFRGLFTPGRPDVIVGSSPHLFACLSAWMLAKVKRSVFVLEIRDLWPESLIAVGANLNRPVISLLSRIEIFLYRRSRKIIVVAEGIKETLIERGFPAAKIAFIPNGVYIKDLQITVAREEMRRGLQLENKFVALYSGSHARCYALDNVLEAALFLREIPDIQIVFLGEGSEKQRLTRRCAELELSNVSFLEPVPKNEVPNYLNMADILILTTQNNYVFQRARPNKLFDYLVSGKPVLCCVEGEMQRVVEESGAGIAVKPEDPSALARGIEYMYRNRHLFPNWENKAHRYVRAHCDREKHAAQLEQLLCTVVRFPRLKIRPGNVVMMVINNFTNDARVDRAASALARKGYTVTVLALKDRDTCCSETINGYRVERIELSLRGLPQRPAFQMPKYIEFSVRAYRRAVALKADIVHAHDLNALPPAYFASKRKRAKLIYDSHELALERNAMQFRPKIEKKLWHWAEQFFIKRCHRVITVSPGIAGELARRYRIKEPIIIMNCPAFSNIPRQNILREKLGLPRENIIILYQGIIAPNRGLEQLVDACRFLSPLYKLVLLGTDSGRRHYLEKKVKEMGLSDRVFFLDPVPVEQVLDHVASADLGTCLVNPAVISHRLTLPNKLFECMACGTPVIASDPYCALIVETGYGRTCRYNDPKAVASVIESIFSDREEYDKMSVEALFAARNKYNWQIESQKLLQLYGRLIREKETG